MDDSGLSATVQFTDGHTLVAIEGDVDAVTVGELRPIFAVLFEGDRPVEVDLARVAFLDSSGIELILELWRRLGQVGMELKLTGVAPEIYRVLELTGVTETVAVAATG